MNLRKATLLAHCDYLSSSGYERARLQLKYRAEQHHVQDVTARQPVAKRILQVERSYEYLCYQIMRMQGKINNVSMTMRQIQQLSVYELYTLKTKLEEQ